MSIIKFPRRPRPRGSKSPSIARDADRDQSIARFREIVRQSADHLIWAEGPVHPDADLLDLCAEALHFIAQAEKAMAAHAKIYTAADADERRSTSEWRAEAERLFQERTAAISRYKPILSRARKLRAKTAAGIYAKALLVRDSRTGAPHLAKSLAEDLIGQPLLRASLWPADTEEAQP